MVHQSQTRLFPEDNPLARYHGDLNGDSDTEGRRPSHIVLKSSTTNGYIPLWEDSDTFTDAQLECCYELGADMRQTLREAQDRYNGGDHKGGSTIFRANVRTDPITGRRMCYVEDVFYTRCGHWASKPRIAHACICAKFEMLPYDCQHKQSRGSVLDEERICDQCIARESGRRASERQVGMWLSVTSNRQGSWVEIDHNPALTDQTLGISVNRRRHGSVPALLKSDNTDTKGLLAAIDDKDELAPRRAPSADGEPDCDVEEQADNVQ